jgi:hypothetical protein
MKKIKLLYLSFYGSKKWHKPLVRSHFPMNWDAHPIPPILRIVQDHKALFVHVHSSGFNL